MTRQTSKIRHDYKTHAIARDVRRPALRGPLLLGVALIGLAVLMFLTDAGGTQRQSSMAITSQSLSLGSPPVRTDTTTTDLAASGRAGATSTDFAAVDRAKTTPVDGRRPGSDTTDALVATGVTHTDRKRLRTIPLALPAAPTAAGPSAHQPSTQATGSPTAPLAISRSVPVPSIPANPAPIVADPVATDDAPTLTMSIRRGDTLDGLFGRHGLSRADLVTLLRADDAQSHLRVLKPGDEILVSHLDGRVLALRRALDAERTFVVTRDEDGFTSRIDFNPVEKRVVHAYGVIDSSLFLAGKEAGVSDNLIMNLAGIFAWDIDFVLDIRKGDDFVVVYEQVWQDGHFLRDGDIVAAEFTNRGDSFRALRFVDDAGDEGYFTPDGDNLRKAFIRAPIAFSPRVTSNFNPRRMHPVHKKVRPHRGVDYGAPKGTPVKAAGDGKVIYRGRKGGYGNTVILQHGGNITTLYAHLSRFNRKAGSGKRVKQGQVIGYVGATGTATASHLHYEYRVGGVHRNPRTVALPKAEPLPARYREAFSRAAKPLVARLDTVRRSLRLADASR